MSIYLKPYGDIIAWCLMPNHFHIMILVNRITVGILPSVSLEATPMVHNAPSDTDGNGKEKPRTLNDSIGIMLRSYTCAINKQENRTGKLFREKTKAECVNCSNGITPSFFNIESGTSINIVEPEKQYPQVCFNYIHQNPVKASLVANPNDWKFSSYPDYFGLRLGKIVNKNVAEQYVSW